jgi:hypothetical protein
MVETTNLANTPDNFGPISGDGREWRGTRVLPWLWLLYGGSGRAVWERAGVGKRSGEWLANGFWGIFAINQFGKMGLGLQESSPSDRTF